MPHNFRILTIDPKKKFCIKEKIRLSIDTLSDLQFFRILEMKLNNAKSINLKNIKKNLQYKLINQHVLQRKVNKKYDNKITFITAVSKQIGMGHLRRTQNLVRDFNETFTSNINLLILFDKTKKNLFRHYKINYLNDLKKIKNENIIVDLPEKYILKYKSQILKNKRIALIDNYKIVSKNIINIIPSYFKINKENKNKNIFSGKEYLSINRDINFINSLELKPKKYILILSGGSSMPPKEIFKIIKKNPQNNYVIAFGPLFFKSLKNLRKIKNLQIIQDAENYFELIKESKNVICRYGITVYEFWL